MYSCSASISSLTLSRYAGARPYSGLCNQSASATVVLFGAAGAESKPAAPGDDPDKQERFSLNSLTIALLILTSENRIYGIRNNKVLFGLQPA